MPQARKVQRVYVQKSRRIKGRGAYSVSKPKPPAAKSYSYSKPGPFGKVGRALGGAAGAYLGGPAGATIGQAVGGLAHYIGKIFGSGDYVASAGVKENSIMQPQAPTFSNNGGTIRVRHREFLGDVISHGTANTFKLDTYAINPGLKDSMPWLSQVCGATFQQYRLNGMVFEYRSMSADALNSTNTALGSVVMATDYDSADVAFTSKQQMENTEFGVSCKPSSNMIHAIECAPQLTSVSEKYIRAYANPDGTDIRLYDMGKFSIATTGFQGTSVNCGELWVSYDVTLMKPIEQVPLYIAPTAYYNLSTASKDTAPFGAAGSQDQVIDQIGLTFADENKITWPVNIAVGSIYQIVYLILGASTAIVAPVVTLSSHWTSLFAGQTPGSTATTFILTLTAKYNGGATVASPAYMNIADSTFPATITYAYLRVHQISGKQPAFQTYVAP